MFQEENSVMRLQLEEKQIQDNLDNVSQFEVKQSQLESSGDGKALQKECFRLNLQLQNQSEKFEVLANKLEGKISRLAAQLKARQKLFTDVKSMKVHTNILQGENCGLKSQLEMTKKQLEKLKDKERCDIAIQTDMVCS